MLLGHLPCATAITASAARIRSSDQYGLLRQPCAYAEPRRRHSRGDADTNNAGVLKERRISQTASILFLPSRKFRSAKTRSGFSVRPSRMASSTSAAIPTISWPAVSSVSLAIMATRTSSSMIRIRTTRRLPPVGAEPCSDSFDNWLVTYLRSELLEVNYGGYSANNISRFRCLHCSLNVLF